jgi:hypothetical protein
MSAVCDWPSSTEMRASGSASRTVSACQSRVWPAPTSSRVGAATRAACRGSKRHVWEARSSRRIVCAAVPRTPAPVDRAAGRRWRHGHVGPRMDCHVGLEVGPQRIPSRVVPKPAVDQNHRRSRAAGADADWGAVPGHDPAHGRVGVCRHRSHSSCSGLDATPPRRPPQHLRVEIRHDGNGPACSTTPVPVTCCCGRRSAVGGGVGTTGGSAVVRRILVCAPVTAGETSETVEGHGERRAADPRSGSGSPGPLDARRRR